VLADTGYSGKVALQFLADILSGIYPIKQDAQRRGNQEGFNYDKQHDRYICPEGKFLTFHNFKKADNSNTHKIYRTSVKVAGTALLK
jgi:hypothetical protein